MKKTENVLHPPNKVRRRSAPHPYDVKMQCTNFYLSFLHTVSINKLICQSPIFQKKQIIYSTQYTVFLQIEHLKLYTITMSHPSNWRRKIFSTENMVSIRYNNKIMHSTENTVFGREKPSTEKTALHSKNTVFLWKTRIDGNAIL